MLFSIKYILAKPVPQRNVSSNTTSYMAKVTSYSNNTFLNIKFVIKKDFASKKGRQKPQILFGICCADGNKQILFLKNKKQTNNNTRRSLQEKFLTPKSRHGELLGHQV